MGMKLRAAVFLAVLASATTASAQVKVSGINSERGRFVFRNDASFLGFGIAAPTAAIGFGSSTLQNADFQPQIAINPSVDIFIINNLSLGATLGFAFNQYGSGFLSTNIFSFAFMPRVGYNIPIVNRLSIWPQFGIGIGVSVPKNGTAEAMVPLDFFVPVCFHPAENFFMGIGPAVRFYSLNDKSTVFVGNVDPVIIDILRFTLAGSVPVF